MASDIFVKMTGIDGESTDGAHKGEIEALSFSTGASMPAGPRSTAGSASRERVSLSDVSFAKAVDSASPALFAAVCKGTHIAEVLISINRAKGDGEKVEYLKYTLTDVLITSYSTSGSDGGGLPIEQVALNFGTIKIDYNPTDAKTGAGLGAKNAGWDVTQNKPV